MSVIVVLIGFSLLVALGFLSSFIWAFKSVQYNDTFTPSVRVLFDESKGSEENNGFKNDKNIPVHTKENG